MPPQAHKTEIDARPKPSKKKVVKEIPQRLSRLANILPGEDDSVSRFGGLVHDPSKETKERFVEQAKHRVYKPRIRSRKRIGRHRKPVGKGTMPSIPPPSTPPPVGGDSPVSLKRVSRRGAGRVKYDYDSDLVDLSISRTEVELGLPAAKAKASDPISSESREEQISRIVTEEVSSDFALPFEKLAADPPEESPLGDVDAQQVEIAEIASGLSSELTPDEGERQPPKRGMGHAVEIQNGKIKDSLVGDDDYTYEYDYEDAPADDTEQQQGKVIPSSTNPEDYEYVYEYEDGVEFEIEHH